MNSTFTPEQGRQIPGIARSYLAARDTDRYRDAAALFAPDATVLEDGKTYTGIDEITAWIENSSTGIEHTSTLISHTTIDQANADLFIRLDGNFPGGTVTQRYRFEIDFGVIRRLDIEIAEHQGTSNVV